MSPLSRTLALLGGILLAACSNTPMADTSPAPSFKNLTPINLAVSQITVTDEYQPPNKAPNVDHLFTTTPRQAVRIWVNDRIRAAGGDRTAEVVIKDASVIETPLRTTQGLKGWFTREQGARYDAKLEVQIKIYSPQRAVSEAEVNVKVDRSRTLSEDASAADKEKLFASLTNDLVAAMNTELEKNIRNYFANYLK